VFPSVLFSVLILAASSAPAGENSDPEVTDTEIKMGQTIPYGVLASRVPDPLLTAEQYIRLGT
jgi:hypothetical protein